MAPAAQTLALLDELDSLRGPAEFPPACQALQKR